MGGWRLLTSEVILQDFKVIYRGTSLIRNTHPPRITIGPEAKGCFRVLRKGGGLMSEVLL